MRWGVFLYTTVIVVFIVLFRWPKMKQNTKKDKMAFLILLFIGWMLSMFDLPHIGGPTAWVETLFRPFGWIVEK